MSTSAVTPVHVDSDPTAIDVDVSDTVLRIVLSDGRELSAPLAWFPRLLHGSAEDREKVWISPSGLHWDELDEDISIAGILAGRGDMTRARRSAA